MYLLCSNCEDRKVWESTTYDLLAIMTRLHAASAAYPMVILEIICDVFCKFGVDVLTYELNPVYVENSIAKN